MAVPRRTAGFSDASKKRRPESTHEPDPVLADNASTDANHPEVQMTDSNDPNVTPPLTPLTPALPEPGPVPAAAPEGVVFHERVAADRGRSTATRVGIITGSALLVLVGVAAAMGASPSPATTPASGVGADPSAAPAASVDPSANPNGPRPGRSGPFGMGLGGAFPGIGVRVP